MTQSAKTAVTLAVLLVLLLVGVLVGWSALTQPLPTAEDSTSDGPCQEQDIAAGEQVRRGMVTVSVFNAGTRGGLAEKTLGALVRTGFGAGETGNADREVSVKRAAVWTTDKRDPAAILVRRTLGRDRTKLVEKPADQLDGVGVMVLVGNKFDKLADGPRQVTSQIDTTICVPNDPVAQAG